MIINVLLKDSKKGRLIVVHIAVKTKVLLGHSYNTHTVGGARVYQLKNIFLRSRLLLKKFLI